MRLIVLLLGIVTAPLALGDRLFLPISESERSRLLLDQHRFLYRNEHAVTGSVNVYRVNANALPEANVVIEIPRDSGEAPLRVRVNSVRPARRSIDGREVAGELLHPKSDETTPILMFLHEWPVNSLDHLPFFDPPDQQFVYSFSGAIPIRWENTIFQIRTLSQSPDMVIVFDIEPKQTTRDMEEFNEHARELLQKHAMRLEQN